jgi:peptidoglycan/LPS O-acetylase OafA/YrhL
LATRFLVDKQSDHVQHRSFSLDVLRTIAVLLVLGRHVPLESAYSAGEPLFVSFVRLWGRVGWTGVDLFFVLSGFLVSGLLFREFIRYGELKIGRFLVRRGLKIYPAFYFFLCVVVLLRLQRGDPPSGVELFAQVAFLQNYLPNFLGHTWSLAVEEHFYILLSILAAASVRFNSFRPFHYLPAFFVLVGVCLLALRFVTVKTVVPFSFETHLFPTHLRADSLLFGVVLAYFYNFHTRSFEKFFLGRHRALILIVSLLLVAPAAFFPIERSAFMQTAGLTLLYLGFGGIVATTLDLRPDHFGRLRLAGVALALVGFYSYSIYLWHWHVERYSALLWTECVGISPSLGMRILIYVPASILWGVALAKMIELPTLRLRDHLFPSRSASVPAEDRRSVNLDFQHPTGEAARS